MAIIKCKMCGGEMVLSPDRTYGVCEYCGSTNTLPKLDDDQRAALFNRGNDFRRKGEFDTALAIYENIIREDDTDAEAHWCCALCRFGIEYVEDPATYEWLPTCHRASFDSFVEDVDYLAAVKHSDGITRRQYQKDAAKIADVQRGILATSQKEEPFDVFICYKETDDATKERTRDSLDAQEIYYQLTQEGYRVFFSRITLEDKAGAEYEPYIFAALNSAKVMVVIGSKQEYVNAVWVKNEWSRFLALMRKDRSKLLLPCYKGMDPYDLPEQLRVLQSYDMTKIGFMQDLIRGVKKVLRKDEIKIHVPRQDAVLRSTGGPNITAQVKRGHQALEDKDWAAAKGFFDKALDMDAECAEAFFGIALAEARCVNAKAFVEHRKAMKPDRTTRHIACERDNGRITAAVQRFASVPGYYDARKAEKHFTYDIRIYDSLSDELQKRIEEEKQYWSSDRNLSRAVRYSKGEFQKELEAYRTEIETYLKKLYDSSTESDEKAKKAVILAYQSKLDEADQAVQDEYQEAMAKRLKDYETYCLRQEHAESSFEYSKLAEAFSSAGMIGFMDCDERCRLCRDRADAILAEEKRIADAERAKKEQIKAEKEREKARILAEREKKQAAIKAEMERQNKEKAKKDERQKRIYKVMCTSLKIACAIIAVVLIVKIASSTEKTNRENLQRYSENMIGNTYADEDSIMFRNGQEVKRMVVRIIDDNTLSYKYGTYKARISSNKINWEEYDVSSPVTYSYTLSIGLTGNLSISFNGSTYPVVIKDGKVAYIDFYR